MVPEVVGVFVEAEVVEDVTPVVEVDNPEDTLVVVDTPMLKLDVLRVIPVVEGDDPEDTSVVVVVELSTGGVVMGSPLTRVVLAMQYHSLMLRLAQLMPVFHAERLAAGTPIMEFKPSQVPFYAGCQRREPMR